MLVIFRFPQPIKSSRILSRSVGTVESSKIIIDRDSGRSKGFGFVEMSTEAEAADAISKFNGADYDGRAMTVNEAKPMAPRDNRGGGGIRWRRTPFIN
jgi:RNA recognition motif-containing protein